MKLAIFIINPYQPVKAILVHRLKMLQKQETTALIIIRRHQHGDACCGYLEYYICDLARLGDLVI